MIDNKYKADNWGNPVVAKNLYDWAVWFEKSDRRVAADWIGNTWLSTVFLGLNQSFSGGSPLLYETLVFGGKSDGQVWRYSTLLEAKLGHEVKLQTLKQERNTPEKVQDWFIDNWRAIKNLLATEITPDMKWFFKYE